jgi:rhamnosyltransferase
MHSSESGLLTNEVHKLCGVVVTYHPPADVAKNLSAMAGECGRLLVIDNGSPLESQAAIAAVPGVTLLPQGRNRGLAAALNVGLRRASDWGCEWVVTFDQDSTPEPGMVEAMRTSLATLPRAALIGPRIHEAGSLTESYRWVTRHPRWSFLFRRAKYGGNDIVEVTMIITSGSMMEVATWRALKGFDEQLFIDYIDTDYCLRVLRTGRTIAVAGQAILRHRLGARETRSVMGREIRPTHHAPFRHYYMARNRVIVWRRHALAVPHWAVFDFCFAVFNTARVLLFERDRCAKMAAMLRGTWHGLLGRGGPIH